MRVAGLKNPDILLTDTVGFIQKLPTNLVAAFRATLEEITEADVLLVSSIILSVIIDLGGIRYIFDYLILVLMYRKIMKKIQVNLILHVSDDL